MKIDTTSFEKAVGQLKKSLSFLRSPLSQSNHDLYEQFRSSVIQIFEYTYEIALKMIRRQLEQIVANPTELREIAFMDFMRSAEEAGLVKNALAFKIYREKRNITSHTYDADKAEEILSSIDSFCDDISYLLEEIKKRNAGC